MSIIKWIRYQWIEPQLNKALKKEAGHKELANELRQKLSTYGTQNRRDRMNMEYNECMADVWQLKRERLETQMEKLKRS